MLIEGTAQIVKISPILLLWTERGKYQLCSIPEVGDGFASVLLQSAVSAEMKKGVGEDACVSLEESMAVSLKGVVVAGLQL